MALPAQNQQFSTPTRRVGAGGKLYSQEQEWDWWLNNGLKGANDYVATAKREGRSPDEIAAFEAYLQQKNPELFQQYQNDQATGSQSGYGAAGRANILLGENLADAELTEEELNDLALSDYTYDPMQEQGQAEGSLVDRMEHAGEAGGLSFADLQERAIDQVRTEQTGIDAQKGVLNELKALYQDGGLSATDRARMAKAQMSRGMQSRANREAVMQRMEQMGRGGSNAEMLAQLDANQAAENALAMDDMETQSLALQRRERLLEGQADVGGAIQSSQDAIDKFNTLGKRDIEMRRNEAEKAGREKQYDENALRDRNLTQDRNIAHGTEWAEKNARESRNVDRTTEARKFAAGPNQGRRGMIADKSAARGVTAGARQQVAGNLTGYEAGRQAQKGAQEAALVAGLGHVGDAVVQGINAADGGDEEEEEE